MHTELVDEICGRYPHLYRYRFAPRFPTYVREGFECQDGWFYLIDLVSSRMEPIVRQFPGEDRPAVLRVRAELGAGYVDLNSYPDNRLFWLRAAASIASRTICEICAAPATQVGPPMRALCGAHRWSVKAPTHWWAQEEQAIEYTKSVFEPALEQCTRDRVVGDLLWAPSWSDRDFPEEGTGSQSTPGGDG